MNIHPSRSVVVEDLYYVDHILRQRNAKRILNLNLQLFVVNNTVSFRPVHSIDGQFGSVTDKEKNLFNGMIGMVQRKVSFTISAITDLPRASA